VGDRRPKPISGGAVSGSGRARLPRFDTPPVRVAPASWRGGPDPNSVPRAGAGGGVLLAAASLPPATVACQQKQALGRPGRPGGSEGTRAGSFCKEAERSSRAEMRLAWGGPSKKSASEIDVVAAIYQQSAGNSIKSRRRTLCERHGC